MIDDLAMMANQPLDESAVRKAHDDADLETEIDKAAAAETMPKPKETREAPLDDTKAERIARRGQDPPVHDDCDPGTGSGSPRDRSND